MTIRTEYMIKAAAMGLAWALCSAAVVYFFGRSQKQESFKQCLKILKDLNYEAELSHEEICDFISNNEIHIEDLK